MSRVLIVIALLGLLAGCAMRQSAREADLGEPCVPAAVAAPSTWTRPVSMAVLLIGVDGRAVAGRRVQYETPLGLIQVWWVGSHIVSIDPAVGDKDVPALYDTGMATSEGQVIADGAPTCRWKPLGNVDA